MFVFFNQKTSYEMRISDWSSDWCSSDLIPNEATLRGTVRTFSDQTLDLIEQRMAQVTEHTSLALNCTSEFAFHRKYPPTINHAKDIRRATCRERVCQYV